MVTKLASQLQLSFHNGFVTDVEGMSPVALVNTAIGMSVCVLPKSQWRRGDGP